MQQGGGRGRLQLNLSDSLLKINFKKVHIIEIKYFCMNYSSLASPLAGVACDNLCPSYTVEIVMTGI